MGDEATKDTITLEIQAEISKFTPTPESPSTVSVIIHGKAYPNVSSGSPFGAGFTCNSLEEAIAKIREYAEEQKKWFENGYFRPVKVKLTIKDNLTPAKQTSLADFLTQKSPSF